MSSYKRMKDYGKKITSDTLYNAFYPNPDAIPYKKKGNTGNTINPKIPKSAPVNYFLRDRETNQIFIEVDIVGSDLEPLLASKNFTKQKNIEMYSVIKPLFFRNETIAFTPDVYASINLTFTQGQGNPLLATTIKPSIYKPYTKTSGSYGINDAPLYLRFPGVREKGDQYAAIHTNTGTSDINLLNPIVVHDYAKLGNPPDQIVYSGTLGNFVYGSCACQLFKKKIIVGNTMGLWQLTMDGNIVSDLKPALMANGLWVPINLHTVVDADNEDNAIIYMTAMVSKPFQYPYYFASGLSITNYSPGTQIQPYQDYQTTREFNGRIVVFKMAVTGGSISQDTVSVVYSSFGGYFTDPVMQKEVNAALGASYGNIFPNFIDTQGKNTIKCKTGGAAPADIPQQPSLTDFCFGVDSLHFRKEKTWDQGLFFKKTEKPFITVSTETNPTSTVKEILIICEGYPVDANRLRYVGSGIKVSAKKLLEPLVKIPAATTNPVSLECGLIKCKFPRGADYIQHFGSVSVDSWGNLRLLHTWDVRDFYTSFLYFRTMHYPRGGSSDGGSCDTFDGCGTEVSYCDITDYTFDCVRGISNSAIQITNGGMLIGARLTTAFWRRMCCDSFDSGSNFNTLSMSVNYGAGMGNDCQTTMFKSSSGWIKREFYPKDERMFFIDSITSQPGLFTTTIKLINKTLNKAYFDVLNSPNSTKQGKILADYRRFGVYDGPTVQMNNPTITDTQTQKVLSIRARDYYYLDCLANFGPARQDYSNMVDKTFTVEKNESVSSPYLYAKVKDFAKIALVKRSYTVNSGGVDYDLREFIETRQAPSGITYTQDGTVSNFDDAFYNTNICTCNSLDWAVYPPIGMTDIFPQDRVKYNGNKTLSGSVIFEGYDVKNCVWTVLPSANMTLYGLPNKIGTMLDIVEYTYDLEYTFVLKAQTAKCGPAFGSCIPKGQCVFNFPGRKVETYIFMK